MHLTEGEIRSFQDGILEEIAIDRVRTHLATCSDCQEKADRLIKRARSVRDHLEVIGPKHSEGLITAQAALTRFETQYLHMESETMFQKIFKRKYLPAWITAGVIAVLAIALLFPSVQAIANSFLGLFRVQQITVVQVDSSNLPDQLANSKQFEALFADNVKTEQLGEPKVVADAAEASNLVGFPVRLPAALEGVNEFDVQQGGKMTFQVDLRRIQDVLRELGREDIQLPPEIDGAQVSIEVPQAVMATYGSCKVSPGEFDPDSGVPPLNDCVTLLQATSPTISAPPGLDIAKIGQAFLQVMGMPADQAQEFSQRIDWATTLVLPLPRSQASYEDVQVDGVNGTLIRESYNPNSLNYMLVWVKDGMVYALSGSGETDKALEIANSLK